MDLDTAIQYDSKFFDAYLTRATFYHSQGDYITSIEDCNLALTLEPTSVGALLIRGACKCKLTQYSRSIMDFSKAISIDRVNKLFKSRLAISPFIIGQ